MPLLLLPAEAKEDTGDGLEAREGSRLETVFRNRFTPSSLSVIFFGIGRTDRQTTVLGSHPSADSRAHEPASFHLLRPARPRTSTDTETWVRWGKQICPAHGACDYGETQEEKWHEQSEGDRSREKLQQLHATNEKRKRLLSLRCRRLQGTFDLSSCVPRSIYPSLYPHRATPSVQEDACGPRTCGPPRTYEPRTY